MHYDCNVGKGYLNNNFINSVCILDNWNNLHYFMVDANYNN